MPLTKKELKSKLSLASQILEEQKNTGGYISSMLLLKRLSDRFDEEVEDAVAQGIPREVALTNPAGHEFFLPEATRWSSLTRAPSGKLAESLDRATQAIEEANSPRLNGVLTCIEWNVESELGVHTDRERSIRDLFNHFGRLDLADSNLGDMGRVPDNVPDEAEDELHTPREVARLIVELMQPAEGMWICDPTAGTGDMLVSAAAYVQEQGGDPHTLVLHGQEIHPVILATAKLNLLLQGQYPFRIEEGDVIREPALVHDSGDLISYDRVIAHPPFGLSSWGHEYAVKDPYNRFDTYGAVPHRSRGEFAFLLHMVAVTSAHGKVGVIMPQSILARTSADRIIRQGLLKQDLFEAVIGLGPRLSGGAGVPAVICVLNKAKPLERRGKVLFVDAATRRNSRRGETQDALEQKLMDRIIESFSSFRSVKSFACVADMAKIEHNDFNLTISQYVRTTETPEIPSVQKLISDLSEAERRRGEAESKMDAVLAEFDFV